MTSLIRIAIVDDQELIRSGLKMVLEVQPDLEVVVEATNGAEALDLIGRSRVDVVLMDIRMPGIDGIEATRVLLERDDAPAVIVLTTFSDDDYVFAALSHGASGFLVKDTPPADLVAAIRAVAGGNAALSPSVARTVISRHKGAATQRHPGLDDLTDREGEVLCQMMLGKPNREVAASLFIAEATVKAHVRQILAKLSVADRTQAVVIAHQAGLTPPHAD